MKRFEAVIFDMDGVIFDSELLVIKCWQVVADKYGIKNIEDTCHKCLGLNKDATKKLMLGCMEQISLMMSIRQRCRHCSMNRRREESFR